MSEPVYEAQITGLLFSPQIDQLATALAKAQSELVSVKKESDNPFFKSKYADLASCWDAARAPLTGNGICAVQQPIPAAPGTIGLRTVLFHKSGQWIAGELYMDVERPATPQKIGSALTYARRYALSAMVGLAQEDDDGNAASAKSEQRGKIQTSRGVVKDVEPMAYPSADKLLSELHTTFDSREAAQAWAAANKQAKESLNPADRKRVEEAFKRAQPKKAEPKPLVLTPKSSVINGKHIASLDGMANRVSGAGTTPLDAWRDLLGQIDALEPSDEKSVAIARAQEQIKEVSK